MAFPFLRPNHTAKRHAINPHQKNLFRKAREAFFIQKGRTTDPDGLNIREETY